MPLTSLVDGEGEVIRVFQENGTNMAEASVLELMESGSLAKQQEAVRNMEIRHDDVLLCTYPKSGTHWVWEIICMLLKGSSAYEKDTKSVLSLDIQKSAAIAATPSPRVLNTHFPVHLIPKGITDNRRKIVLVHRNPKDAAVSMYHMMKKVKQWNYNGSFRGYLPLFTGEQGQCFIYSWFDYVLEWERFIEMNKDFPILQLFFEDLKLDLKTEVTKLDSFLETDHSEDLLAEIVKNCQFENLKRANDEFKDDPTKELSKDGEQFIYRKGEVGDWKNWFTVANNDCFDAVFRKKMSKSSLHFKFTL